MRFGTTENYKRELEQDGYNVLDIDEDGAYVVMYKKHYCETEDDNIVSIIHYEPDVDFWYYSKFSREELHKLFKCMGMI